MLHALGDRCHRHAWSDVRRPGTPTRRQRIRAATVVAPCIAYGAALLFFDGLFATRVGTLGARMPVIDDARLSAQALGDTRTEPSIQRYLQRMTPAIKLAVCSGRGYCEADENRVRETIDDGPRTISAAWVRCAA